MPKVLGVTPNQISGKVGGLIYEQFEGDTFVYAAPTTHKDSRTPEILAVRAIFSSLSCNFSAYDGLLNYTLEPQKKRQNPLSIYIKMNYPKSKVWLTRRQIEEGYQILEPLYVSSGSSDGNVETLLMEDRVMSNISTGSLVVDENTTVDELVGAILANNEGSINQGDSIYFIRVTQKMATNQLPPKIKPRSRQFVIRPQWAPSEETKVFDLLGQDGFTTMPFTPEDGCACNVLWAPRDGVSAVAWVISHPVRINNKGSLSDFVCSTQKLTGDFPLVEEYSTPKCKTLAFNSFGGINKFNHVSSNNRYSTEQRHSSPSLGGEQTEVREYDLALAVSPADSGTVTGAGRYQVGANVALRAVAASGFRFLNWNDGSTDAERTVQMPASNYTYTAYFERTGSGNTGGGTGNTDPTNPGLGGDGEDGFSR